MYKDDTMDDLASSGWENPSQSFGYNQQQAKNPFAAAANANSSPAATAAAAAAAAYRIRWHNSVVEDFTPTDDIGSFLKRSASVALPETNLVYPDQLLPLEQDAITTTNTTISPTQTTANPPPKRRKPSTSTIASSPVKPKKAAAVASAAATSSPLDPAAAPVKRRRGRPPKNPVPILGASQIAFVTEQIPGVPPPAAAPEEASQLARAESSQPGRPHSSPVLQPLDTFVAFSNPGLAAMTMETLGDADFQQNKYWDASFAGSMISDNGHMTSSFAAMPGDIALVSAAGTFDWSVPTSLDMMASQSVMMDPLRPLSMHNPLAESFFAGSSHDPHALNFSFAADPLSASDIISPVSINPGIVFGGGHFGGSFADGVEPFRPYHQQNLQQQQEQLDEQRKRQKKVASTEAQVQTASKTAAASAAAAASRPVLNRALTESALLTTSASKSKASNVTVHPSPVKQMFPSSSSGKMKPAAARDENTTPSPSVDTISVRHVTPKSSDKKRRGSSRKVRTAVNFTISPGGRAKAERVVIRDPDSHSEGSGTDNDQGDYDTDSSTDEDDLGPLSSYSMAAQRLAGSKGRSHRGSSSFSRSMERPKLARFKTAPAAGSFSSSSQYLVSGDFTSDSFGIDSNPFLPPNMSMSSSIGKSPRKASKHGKGSRRHNRGSSSFSMKSGVAVSRTNLGSMREDEEYSEAETVIDEPVPATPGDAVLALKEAVARRNSFCAPGATSIAPWDREYGLTFLSPGATSKRPSSSSYGTSRPSTRHTNGLPSSPPAQQHQPPYGFSTPQTVRSGYSSDAFNISPTTVTDPDCVTPTTFSKQSPAGQEDIAMDIRCRCGTAGSPEMPVIQW
ncbi:hypothetical protein Dda_9189 [Drechslerella dactyloides]|uniref:Uncharacterized protein n=1 Tax=Drechslerella dactyloides TaxID=74499 RepID=A0AAD6IPW4_DREDA|nr:hypothetical protein Dda_9189 [Drechslerella dactyloides]